jgi:hypothetical protein
MSYEPYNFIGPILRESFLLRLARYTLAVGPREPCPALPRTRCWGHQAHKATMPTYGHRDRLRAMAEIRSTQEITVGSLTFQPLIQSQSMKSTSPKAVMKVKSRLAFGRT